MIRFSHLPPAPVPNLEVWVRYGVSAGALGCDPRRAQRLLTRVPGSPRGLEFGSPPLQLKRGLAAA